MSITFRIGKDDITRKISTCLLPLELVKTSLQNDEYMSITFRIGKDDITRKINTCLLPLLG